MRLIDADALNPKFVHGRWDDRYVSEKEVQDAPTVEPIKVGDVCKECWRGVGNVVQVVHCKDCKWYKTNYSWNGTEHKVCVRESYEPTRKAIDYCSHGERRTE